MGRRETLHFGFGRYDCFLLSNIRGLNYDYLRNGKETSGLIIRVGGPSINLMPFGSYDTPIHDVFSHIAELVGLERRPDREYRYRGRWTSVGWGQNFEDETTAYSLRVGFERP